MSEDQSIGDARTKHRGAQITGLGHTIGPFYQLWPTHFQLELSSALYALHFLRWPIEKMWWK